MAQLRIAGSRGTPVTDYVTRGVLFLAPRTTFRCPVCTRLSTERFDPEQRDWAQCPVCGELLTFPPPTWRRRGS